MRSTPLTVYRTRSPAQKDRYLVYLVVWLNKTNQMNQTNQIDQACLRHAAIDFTQAAIMFL